MCASLAVAAGKPDFSGEWTLDAARSALGPFSPSYSLKRVVTHREPKLTIVESQGGGPGDSDSTRIYSTDGTVSMNTFMAIPVQCTAVWAGDSLVITINADVEGFPFRRIDQWTLSSDGKTLTSIINVHGGDGDFEFTYVMKKK